MSLLETLLEKGGDLIDDKGEDWVDEAVATGRDIVNEALADEDDPLQEKGAKVAHEALDRLAAHKRDFVALGKVGFAWLVAHWEDDGEAAAKRYYLEREATFAERRAAMHAAGDAVAAARKAREEAWESVAHTMRQVGETAFKALVKAAPLLLGIA